MRVFLFAASLPLLATTTVQQVAEVSAQQAIIRYRTTLSPATACSWAVTETVSGLTPDDVNTTLFPNSNLDTRAGSIIKGQDRVFVLGLRYSTSVSSIGSDGNTESRSLKANTAYTATVTCGSDSPVTVQFATGTIQLGGTYTEQPPYNASSSFGNWAWPSTNWSTQSKQYVDPQTGVVIQRVTSPGLLGKESGLTNFDFAIGGTGYINPQNILNGASCTGSRSSCAESTNGNPIFVSMKGQNYTATNTMYSSGYSSTQTYDDILVTLTGLASASGAEPVSVCLSYYDSGATCNTATQTITLSTGSTSTVGFPEDGVGYTAPNNQWDPEFQFGEWGGTAPKQGDFGMAFGTSDASTGVTTSGTAVTVNCHSTNASYSCFNVKWNNAYFYIQGSGCTGPNGETEVCQINGHPADTEHLMLKTAPASPCSSQCNWNSLSAGVKITPNGVGTVDIGAQYSYAYSSEFQIYINGISQVCNPVPVSVGYEADGTTPISPAVPGNLCLTQTQDQFRPQYAVLILLIPSTGETRLLSTLLCSGSTCDPDDASGDQVAAFEFLSFQASSWDGVSGLCFYGTGPASSGPISVYKGCYNTADNWKAYSHPLYACGNCGSSNGGVYPGQDPNYPSYTYTRWSDDPITYTNITPPSKNLGILQQIEANNTSYQSTIWTYFILEAVGNGTFTIALTDPQQGTSASIAIFSTSTGLIQSWGDTFFGSNGFCGLHGITPTNVAPGYVAEECNYLDANSSSLSLGGPFQSTPYWVCSGPGTGSCSTNTALTATSPLEPCSNYTISSGIMSLITEQGSQNQCMHIRMKNVTNHTPSAAELALWPSSQNAAWSEPQVLQPGNTLALPNEQVIVAAVTTGVTDSQCSSDCLDVVVARGKMFGNGNGPATETNGWSGCAGPTLAAAGSGCGATPGVGAWIPVNITGNFESSIILDPVAFGSHSATGPGLSSGNMTFVAAGPSYRVRYNKTISAQAGSFTGANQIVLTSVPFYGEAGSITLQSYPSNEQYANPSNWFLDYNHTSPGEGDGGEQFIQIDGITYSLVGGTSTVYKVTAPAGGLTPNEANYKTNGLQGWAGPNLLLDVSGPSSSLSDSTEYEVCMTLMSGECYAGSSAGNVYVTVPNVPSVQSNCITDWLVQNYPCAAMSFPDVTGALTQHDASYSYGVGESGRVLLSRPQVSGHQTISAYCVSGC